MSLAAAVCAALVARARTGVDQLVTTSLYRQGAYTVSFDLNTLLHAGHSAAIGEREHMGNPCTNNYNAGGRASWTVGLRVRVVGRARSDTARAGATNATELIRELDAIFVTKPLDEWVEVFAAEPDFFWSPINSMNDVLADAQCHEGGGIVYVPDGESTPRTRGANGTTPMVATPAEFHGTAWTAEWQK